MRRKDREITAPETIDAVIDRCQVLRLGLYDAKLQRPYVVPFSFGWERQGAELVFYLHCAKVGYKLDLLAEQNRVCVELDRFLGYAGAGSRSTTYYESCIGFGTAALIEGEAALHGLELLMAHCGREAQDFSSCLPHTAVICVRVPELSVKANLPG